MNDLVSYRGSQKLAAPDVRRIVLSIVAESAPGRAGSNDVEALADELLACGVAVGEHWETDGYRQILGLLVALLLRVAGANVASAVDTVSEREPVELEKMVGSILARLAPPAAEPSAAAPVVSADGQAEPRPTGENESASIRASRSVPAALNTGEVDIASARDSSGASASSGSAPQEVAPLAYLRAKLDDALRRTVRNIDPLDVEVPEGRSAVPSTASGPREILRSASVAIGDVTRLEELTSMGKVAKQSAVKIAPGVTVLLDPDKQDGYRAPADRAELIRAFAFALEKVLG